MQHNLISVITTTAYKHETVRLLQKYTATSAANEITGDLLGLAKCFFILKPIAQAAKFCFYLSQLALAAKIFAKSVLVESHQDYCLSSDELPWYCGASVSSTCLQLAMALVLPLAMRTAYQSYRSYQAIYRNRSELTALFQGRLQAHLQQRQTDMPRMQRLLEMAMQQMRTAGVPTGLQPN